ncbi:MAG: T9SS type A sorting domain-containing protein [Chitinophagaceae bacterium]
MRIKYLPVIIAMALYFNSSGQTNTTVYTCKNGTVAALITAESYSPSQIQAINAQMAIDYSYLGITVIGDATTTYNCHSYAWHLREGNTNKVWINNATYVPSGCFPETHNIDKYWTDKCFIQVCNESDADKVHYYCGDHSAVASTTNPGYFESKWGPASVVRHTRTGVAYEDPVNSVNFYASTTMSGATTELCSGTRAFSVKNISGATYTWTYSGYLSVVGATNTNQLVVQQNGSIGGPAYVQVQISTPCSASPVTIRKDFHVGTPASPYGTYTHNGGYYSYPSNLYTNPAYYGMVFYNNNMCTVATTNLAIPPMTTTSWTLSSVTPSSPPVYWYPTGQNLYVTLTNTQTAVFQLTLGNVCGNSIPYLVGFKAGYCSGYRSSYTLSSNPVRSTSKLTISAEGQNRKAEGSHSTITEVIIYDQQGLFKKRQRFGKTPVANVDLSGLNTGIYIVEIIDGAYKERKQIVVQK